MVPSSTLSPTTADSYVSDPPRQAPYFVVKATPGTPNEQGERFDLEAIDEAVDRLAGRPGIHAVVLPRLHGHVTRVAVAVLPRRLARSGWEMALWPGRLFIVEVVRP